MNKDNNVKKINSEDLINYYVKLTSNLNYELAIKNILINKLKEIIAKKDKEIEALKGEDKKPPKEKEE